MDSPLSCYALITNYVLISYAKGHSDQTNTCSVLEVSLHFVTSDPLLPYIWHKWQFLELKNPYLHTKTTDMCQFGAKILFLYFLGAILDFESILNLGCLTWKAITQLDSLTSKTHIYTKKVQVSITLGQRYDNVIFWWPSWILQAILNLGHMTWKTIT